MGVAAALPLALWMWGFTVDDALISVRYARHLAEGAGYRFNVGEAVTDGVTPLPWAFLLGPFAGADPMTVLVRAKCLGLGAWLVAAAAWGAAVVRAPAAAWAKGIAVVVLALSVPVAAHAVSGMETAVAMALATCASVASSARAAACFAGLAAALRPEMAAWALVLAAVRGLASDGEGKGASSRSPWERALLVAIAVGPFAACAVARVIAFGRAAPLAVLAKPSDLAHGFAYAVAASVVALGPIAAAAPFAYRRAPSPASAIALAGVAHLCAVVAVGGDWMPYARLVAPIVPSLLYAFVLAAPHARTWANAVRGGLALCAGVVLIAMGGTSGRTVSADRVRLVERARPELAAAHRVAAVDIGWVGAATEASIVDLAGVTDPTIAVLPGGHTSKHVDASMLLERDPDVILLYAATTIDLRAWHGGRYPRALEAYLARSERLAERYDATAWLPLGSVGAGYVLLRRLPR